MFRKYIRLAKPRITLLVVVTTYLGYYLGLRYTGLMMIELDSIVTFFNLVLGVILTSSGSAILNQYIERDLDAKMDRTKSRPLVNGTIKPTHAIYFSLFLSFSSILMLYILVNTLTALLTLLSIIIYSGRV